MTETAPHLKIKDIEWPTNVNGKMSCNGFIHITLEPAYKPLRHEVERTIYRIIAKDGSHKPVFKRITDLAFTQYSKLIDWLTFASHGCNTEQLIKVLEEHHNTQIFLNTRIMIQYFSPFEMERMED